MSTKWSNIEAQLRTVFALGVGYLAASDFIPAGLVEHAVTALMGIAAFAWAAWANRSEALVKAAEGVPEVSKIQLFSSDSGVKIHGRTGNKVTLERKKK